ncbi:MAG: hypothetical protein MRECE_11c039 [Mycoplasmataceae bacterium CE_OT135]|nr:MAG: hypothetical protein MRECE_11c039 [Mycoplasmataceae bacterium CE_OT135]
MNKKLEKHLKFTCSHCFSAYQLLEIHEKEANNCSANCLKAWQKLLHDHYQEQIILHLAKEEAAKEKNHD